MCEVSDSVRLEMVRNADGSISSKPLMYRIMDCLLGKSICIGAEEAFLSRK